jgi:hypothetical protein
MFCLIVVYKHGHAYVITSTEGHVEAQKWMGDEFKGWKHRRGVVAMSRCVAKQRTVMVIRHMQLRRSVHVRYTRDVDQSGAIRTNVQCVSANALTAEK